MTGRSGTRSRSHFTPRSARGTRSPATTRTSNCGRASPDGKSQPRVNSTCKSDKTHKRTSVLVLFFVERLGLKQRLDKLVRQLVHTEREHHIRRSAAWAFVALRVVDELAFPAAGGAAKSGHGASPRF